MESLVLATKLQIPPQTKHIIPRARLSDTLERDLPHRRIVLIAAPAGYGKTTLLCQWGRASRHAVAWLSLGEEDNDEARFFRYLLKAWERVEPGIGDGRLGALLEAMAPDSEAVLAAFLNAAQDVAGHTAFVLDDYHLISDPAIHRALAFLLDHLPATLHFVLAGREEPPLALARYRARDELLEIRAEDLRFSKEETADFLRERMGLALALSDAARLQAQAEGWIAGLQLAALATQRRPGAEWPAISGRQRFVADYLSEEVLGQLEQPIADFALQTGILDRLSGALCDAVTGRSDGQEMLEVLERRNLFLAPLDDERRWFRYHPLFADFLREALERRQPDEAAQLHQRAAAWHAAHDHADQAFRHAVAAQDAALTTEICERYVNAKLLAGETRVVQRWVETLPKQWYLEYPVLGLARAGLLALTGDFAGSVRCVAEVEQGLAALGNDEARRQGARVTAVRCLMACMSNELSRAEAFADRALRELPQDDLGFRPGIYGALGDSYRQNGRWQQARECYLKALDFSNAPSVRVQAAHVYGALADLELRQGRLQNAAGHWRKALAAIRDRENWGRLPLPVIGWVYIRMGELHYEWNQPAQAWEHVARGLERAEAGGDVRALIAGHLVAARLKLAAGDLEPAEQHLEQARPLVEKATFHDWTSNFERCQLELWLAQDKLRTAVHWADEMLKDPAREARPESEVAQLAMARVLIVKGDAPSVERALAQLRRLLETSEAEGRMGVTIEALALQALAQQARGARAEALVLLERALRLAEPEGYVRVFADLGLPLARLLQEARSRGVMTDYVDRLLAAFGDDATVAAAGLDRLPEPLTDRELEVLRLLGSGLTNREIGERLVISPETVKKHSANIYGKLSARNRTQAVARARDLRLLD